MELLMDITEWLPEFPVSAEEDKDLMTYFFNVSYIQEILDNKKWIVLGRKGTGKTAIYEYFIRNESLTNKYILIPLNFKDYPWPIHQLYKQNMESELNPYSNSWDYIITLNVLVSYIKNIDNKELDTNLKNVKEIIKKLYGSPFPSLIDIIKGKILRLDKISFPNVNAGSININLGEVSFEKISESKELIDKLKTNAFNLLVYFKDILSKIRSDKKIIILFDQLDENWLEGQLSEYSKVLISLINICKSVNISNKNIQCILFLRSDIFDTLKFNDKNKIRESSSIDIKWNLESLNDMFFERIIRNKPTDIRIDESLKSNSIFIKKEVRHRAKIFKYIINRTFYRPRDIIVFFNKIRKAHKKTDNSFYSSENLYSAANEFSSSLYNELMDEWTNQKPEIKNYLKILQNIGNQIFTYGDFNTSYKNEFKIIDKANVEEALLFLYNNSILGQKKGAIWYYFCNNQYQQIDYKKEFHVNPGLSSRLNLTESRVKHLEK